MEKPLPVSTVKTILSEVYSTSSERASYGGQYLETQQIVLETHQYIPGAQRTLLQTQLGIIETQYGHRAQSNCRIPCHFKAIPP